MSEQQIGHLKRKIKRYEDRTQRKTRKEGVCGGVCPVEVCVRWRCVEVCVRWKEEVTKRSERVD